LVKQQSVIIVTLDWVEWLGFSEIWVRVVEEGV